MNYNQALEFLYAFPDMERGTAPSDQLCMSLDTMKSLLARLHHPELGRRTIHVTGSKGKGSTSTMIASLLRQGGMNVALYTSPHLHSYTERMQFNLAPITEHEFAKALASIKDAIETEHSSGSGPVVTFGILTALFFQLARTWAAEWQVVEVGLGGADDATNVFERKEVAVITPISLEHTAILGKTHAQIAERKAGIITPGCKVVLAPQKEPSVKAVVANRCREVGATLVDVENAVNFSTITGSMFDQFATFRTTKHRIEAKLGMIGEHQATNAATAIAAAEAISGIVELSDHQFSAALEAAKIAGRFEVFHQRPSAVLDEAHNRDSAFSLPVVLDGAHNRDSALCLVRSLAQHFRSKKCLIILGVNKDKDVNAILYELSKLEPVLIATQSSNHRAMPAQEIAEHAAPFNIEAIVEPSVAKALGKALTMASKQDYLCVTGSLYTVAEARQQLLGQLQRSP